MSSIQEQPPNEIEESEERVSRMRKYTERGRQYEIEKHEKDLQKLYKNLEVQMKNIEQMLSEEADESALRNDIREWMEIYERFSTLHNELCDLLSQEEHIIYYKETFAPQDASLRKFKQRIQSWMAQTAHETDLSKVRISRNKLGSSRSVLSSRSSHVSITSIRFKEQQRHLELTAEATALKKRQAIMKAKLELEQRQEQEKLKLEQEHEEMLMKVELEKVASKCKALTEMEDRTKGLGSEDLPGVASVREENIELNLIDNTEPLPNYVSRNSREDLSSIVKILKKPSIEIMKFSGNPLHYRQFLRQFRSYVSGICEDDGEKLNYLLQYTTGEAHRRVSGYGYLESSVGLKGAMAELHDCYGRPDVIARALVNKALGWSEMRTDSPKQLDEFAMFLTECKFAIMDLNEVKVLNYPDNISSLVKKLPLPLHEKWRSVVQNLRSGNKEVDFEALVNFVRRESRKANDPTYGRKALVEKSLVHEKSRPFRKKGSFSVNSLTGNNMQEKIEKKGKPDQKNEEEPCLYCKNKSHTLPDCEKLREKPIGERREFVRKSNVCFGCYKLGHPKRFCRQWVTCKKCHGYHAFVMHDDNFVKSEIGDPINSNVTDGLHTGAGHMGAGQVCKMAILPVKVKIKGKATCVSTYAFMDSGSTVSFATTSLINSIGGTGRKKRITLDTMGGTHEMNSMVIDGLEVSSLCGNEFIPLPRVYSKHKMPVNRKHIPTKEDISRWSHLSDVELPELDVEIGILIGNNVPDAYCPLDLRVGPRGSPHATKTMLGWIVWNVVREKRELQDETLVNRTEVTEIEEINDLDKIVRESINFDFPERVIDDKRENSEEDKQFLRKVDETVKLKDGHYEIALPFKQQKANLPNNRIQAAQRLGSLKRKMIKNQVYAVDYTKFMEDLLVKGYAEEVPKTEIDRKVGHNIWYIPHHGVYHPKKPEKIRVVFDCAAVYEGISLNHLLLPGPNLTNNLIGVLLRFREQNVAILGDIESMFYQVRVPKENADCLRFLWWPKGDYTQEPSTYRMKVHLFGATSSPSCSNAALRLTATNNRSEFSADAVNTLLKNFYVDDCLKSVETEEKAVNLISELKKLCMKGGFNITKWASNRRAVIESVAVDERSKELKVINLDQDVLPVGRALGVAWFPEVDQFGFQIEIPDRKFSRRGVLSVVSSVYDPLGFASPYILPAKVILQLSCRLSLSWDEQIPENLLVKWKKWLLDIRYLEDIKIPRCYKPPDFNCVTNSQLHVFSDASESAYGAVMYLRLVDGKGEVSSTLVLGKSRVAPLKKITIPRMELTAAVTAVRLTKLVLDELEMTVNKVYYWTDSQTVLNYIANVKVRFHTFVANRTALIREATDLTQWRYCPSEQNPADIASRGTSPKDVNKTQLWISGPDFLRGSEEFWPTIDRYIDYNEEDLEIKEHLKVKPVSNAVADRTIISFIGELIDRCSSWKKIRNVIGYVLVFIERLKYLINKKGSGKKARVEDERDTVNGSRDGRLTVQILMDAERIIIRHFQEKAFPQEIYSLKSDLTIKKSSPLFKLDPYLEKGLIRVGGRLNRAHIDHNTKHPVIIPKQCPLPKLMVEESHRLVGHLGKRSTIAKIREKYWIIGLSQLAKKFLSKCVICRKYKARAMSQKMADLPESRLMIGEPPFTRVGIDYWGPMEIKRGRSLLKRYGVIFTCLVTRAVHLEVSNSLDTSSCINAIRRFVARRGPVKEMISDNGTNLVGAKKEMRTEIEKWNNEQIERTLLQQNIKWSLNPPTGSHFGGIWERMIRTVRKVLYSIMKEQIMKIDDEGLQTLLCEIENIVNGRPLTEISDDPREVNLEVLTPNHLLKLRKGPELPPGMFSKTDNYVGRRWRQIQYIADVFWKRWTREYFPLLQSRQKWIKARRNLEVDDLVLLVDSTPRNSWNLGKVVQVIKDKRGLVRIAHVKTKTSVLQRPIDKLCLILEGNSD